MALLTLVRRCGLPAVLVLMLLPAGARTAPITEAEVKAGLLYNFASFVEWPEPLPSDRALVVCVAGDDAVAQAVRGLPALPDGRALEVWIVDAARDLRQCHLLYVAAVSEHAEAALLARLDRTPVLTVGEGERFTQLGGMIRLFAEKERMRFEVHLGHAASAHLRISSRVLNLASAVSDADAQRN
jgi:hypothetical protein